MVDRLVQLVGVIFVGHYWTVAYFDIWGAAAEKGVGGGSVMRATEFEIWCADVAMNLTEPK
jgi:hypothetical protein